MFFLLVGLGSSIAAALCWYLYNSGREEPLDKYSYGVFTMLLIIEASINLGIYEILEVLK